MKNNLFYSLIVLLVLVLNSCSFFEQKEPIIEFKLIKQKALDAENNNKVDSAFYYLNTISNDENYILDNRVYAKLEKARLYYLQCDYIESESETIEAIAINTNPVYNSYLHNMLGTAFQEQRKFDKATEQLYLATKNTTDSLHNAVIQSNLSLVYLDNEEYNKAIQTLEPLLNNKALKENPFFFSKVVDNLGYAYLKKGLPEAQTLLEKGLQIRDSIDDNFSKISSYIHLSNYFEQKLDIEKTNEFALKAYSIATASKSPDDRLEALDIIIKNNTDTKEWYLKYAHINDSIQKERNFNKNQFAQIKYDASKSETQSKILKTQKEKLTISIVAIILLSLISFILIRIKNKQKQLKTVYDTETRISKQLHDELANDVFNTLTFIENQDISTTQDKERIVNEIDKIYKRTRSISHENSSIEVGTEYPKELRALLNNFITSEIQVATKGIDEVNWNKILPIKKIALYRVLQELMVNMKKHSKCSLVFVAIISNKDTLEIKYSDNGIGLQEEKFKIGLQNVENRIKSINGTITFESNNGLKVKINIPI
ncbi:ATP-binding protein [Flavobacterium sp.]|jgi:signal transduction histidine kinase|uniref:tetratricopeptide repeat-containing sensor histidine kinase n=1 Tax=Flavobacterium sp. TaxID=239 RepID=UPI002A7F18EE|nr:ATP-binding protein [Flavobacterium sp.]